MSSSLAINYVANQLARLERHGTRNARTMHRTRADGRCAPDVHSRFRAVRDCSGEPVPFNSRKRGARVLPMLPCPRAPRSGLCIASEWNIRTPSGAGREHLMTSNSQSALDHLCHRFRRAQRPECRCRAVHPSRRLFIFQLGQTLRRKVSLRDDRYRRGEISTSRRTRRIHG